MVFAVVSIMRYLLMHQVTKYARDAPDINLIVILLILYHFRRLEHGSALLGNHLEILIQRLLTDVEVHQFHGF